MEWTIQDLGAIGEFVGAFAVVVTLIYLTLQVRQSTAQARLTSIQAVNASNDSAFNPIYIPENTRIWTVGQENPDALEHGEWQIFGLLMTRLIASFDTWMTRSLERESSYQRALSPMALSSASASIRR